MARLILMAFGFEAACISVTEALLWFFHRVAFYTLLYYWPVGHWAKIYPWELAHSGSRGYIVFVIAFLLNVTKWLLILLAFKIGYKKTALAFGLLFVLLVLLSVHETNIPI